MQVVKKVDNNLRSAWSVLRCFECGSKKMGSLFSEDMFLFFEEAWLANKAYSNGVKVYYIPQIVIDHKEDGSMKIADVNICAESRKSVMYYYEHKKVQN